jgi:hypothetical protein
MTLYREWRNRVKSTPVDARNIGSQGITSPRTPDFAGAAREGLIMLRLPIQPRRSMPSRSTMPSCNMRALRCCAACWEALGCRSSAVSGIDKSIAQAKTTVRRGPLAMRGINRSSEGIIS